MKQKSNMCQFEYDRSLILITLKIQLFDGINCYSRENVLVKHERITGEK